jgi:hypothetical protein
VKTKYCELIGSKYSPILIRSFNFFVNAILIENDYFLGSLRGNRSFRDAYFLYHQAMIALMMEAVSTSETW